MSYYSPMRSRKVSMNGDIEKSETSISDFCRKQNQTLAAYNPNTTYGLSYNPDHGKAARIKNIGKHVLDKFQGNQEIKFQGIKINSSVKPMLKVVDEISEVVSNYGRRLSPLRLTNKLDIKADYFEGVVKKRDSSVKVSEANTSWLVNKEKAGNMQKLLNGEFIPSINQLYLYGRRAEKSLFERRGLSESFINN